MKTTFFFFSLLITLNVDALTPQQIQFKTAYTKALKGDKIATNKAKKKLKSYRLLHYLDYALLKANMADLPIQEIENFSKLHINSPLVIKLEQMLLYELGKQKQWIKYLEKYKNSNGSQSKYCWFIQAKIATNKTKDIYKEISSIWMNGLSLPAACNSVFKWWENQGQLNDKLLIQRFKMTYKINNASTARYLSSKMKKRPTWVRHAISLMEKPIQTLKKSIRWRNNSQNRDIIYQMSKRMASKQPNTMHSIWKKLKKYFKFSAKQKAQVERTIALYAATDYLPFTIKAMNKLPDKQHDTQINAWKVRYHLYHGQWKSVIKAINKMPAFQQQKDSWKYWLARAQAKVGKTTEAKKTFSELAKKTSYYGFLAADHVQTSYQICEKDMDAEKIEIMPENVLNAFELFELNMITLARREWIKGYRKLSIPQRRALADIAYEKGWYNKVSAIMGALNLWQNYKLRYPLAYKNEIKELSKKYNMQPQWIMSIITQESAWQTDAISRADARGLMQLIEPTAKRLSKKLGIKYQGKAHLHDANYNLKLGIYYQSELFNRFQNHPLLALASYNAGETKANDWLKTFPTSPDVWAETIPYQETRGYIRKILTNVTIYDWLINKNPKRISYWMPTFPIKGEEIKKWPNKQTSSQKTQVVCPL